MGAVGAGSSVNTPLPLVKGTLPNTCQSGAENVVAPQTVAWVATPAPPVRLNRIRPSGNLTKELASITGTPLNGVQPKNGS